MGLLDIYARTSGINEPPAQSQTRTLAERAEATFDATFSPGRYFNIVGAQRDAWQRSIDEIAAVGGPKLANPYMPVTTEEIQRLGNQPAVEAERRNKVIEAARAAREQYPDLYDPENIDRYIGEEDRRRQEKAESYVGTGNGIGNFLVGAGLETLTPHGLVGLAVPVTRLPLAASSAVGRTFLGDVLKEAGFQAGANAALQAAAEGLDYASRSQLGNAPGLGDMVSNVAGAALVGGVLGGSIRALHLKWLGLPEKVRMEAPLEVRDAFRAIEADALYSGQNRLGIDSLLHERFVEQSMDPILRGRMPDFSAQSIDTPFSALGTILRTVPDQVSVRGLEGLGSAMDRVRALPNRELEAFAREIAPRPFERLDAVQAEIAQVRAQLADLNARTPSPADLLDPDTAMRLQDIERDLSAPALSRKQRQALEDERAMIMESIDPADRLPKQAEKAQRQQAAALEKQIAKLEEKQAEFAPKAEKAVADLRRKLDRYAFAPGFEWAGKPDQPWTGPRIAKDLGFTAPADLDAAIARAEALRQARVVREILPEGAPPRQAAPEPQAMTADTPEALQAIDSEVARVMEARAGLEIRIGDRTLRAADALEESDRLAKDAQAAIRCAMGAPI